MTWDVPVKDNCPQCGQTMFKLSGRGARKPFCINPECPNFTPEDQRGGWRKKTETSGGAAVESAPAEQSAGKKTEAPKSAAKKTAAKAAAAKKPAAKKTTPAKKTAAPKKTAAAKKTEG